MTTTFLVFDKRSHLPKVVKDLLFCGWSIETTPLDGRIPRNGLKTILDAESEEIKLAFLLIRFRSPGAIVRMRDGLKLRVHTLKDSLRPVALRM